MAGLCVWLLALWCVAVVAADITTPVPSPQTDTCDPKVPSFLEAVGHLPDCVASINNLKSLVEEMREIMRGSRPPVTPCPGRIIEEGEPSRPRHCQDLLEEGDSGRGVRLVYPYPDRPDEGAAVFCDHTVDEGGWTLFQRRTNATTRVTFERTWAEYRLGFGSLTGEMWMGLDLLEVFTTLSTQEMRVDLSSFTGEHRWAKYGLFTIGPLTDNYRLQIGRYTGDATDSMSYNNGQQFTTKDAEHDIHSSVNCAEFSRSGWWHRACTSANLNGYQYEGDGAPVNKGIYWAHWKGVRYSLMNTTMMMRPTR